VARAEAEPGAISRRGKAVRPISRLPAEKDKPARRPLIAIPLAPSLITAMYCHTSRLPATWFPATNGASPQPPLLTALFRRLCLPGIVVLRLPGPAQPLDLQNKLGDVLVSEDRSVRNIDTPPLPLLRGGQPLASIIPRSAQVTG
jgi:hypothetical protein